MDNLFLVIRKKNSVIVPIMKHKSDETYSFVNITKGHICSCRFHTFQEALEDLEKQIRDGHVISYHPLIMKE